MTEKLKEGIKNTIQKSVLKTFVNASILHPDNTIIKYIDGEFIRKPCELKDDGRYDWI